MYILIALVLGILAVGTDSRVELFGMMLTNAGLWWWLDGDEMFATLLMLFIALRMRRAE